MALGVEKWRIPSLQPRSHSMDDPDWVNHYKIGGIWIEVVTYEEFDGYSAEISHQSYERIDEPDLKGAKLLKQREFEHVGDSNRDIAVYIHTRFTRPSLMLYPGMVEDVMKALHLAD